MKEKANKVWAFCKRNAQYAILALCVLAVGLSIALVCIKQNEYEPSIDDNPPVVENKDPVIDEPVVDIPEDLTPAPSTPVDEPITFVMPVANATDINGYSETAVFSSTLSRYTVHQATDFYAPEGTTVVAVYKGTVASVENDVLKGYTITIDHGDGLVTVYNSLSENVKVTVGQKVAQGEAIGEVSVTNRQEYKDGAHLHFEVMQNGESIDPAKYLEFDNK